MLKKRGYPKGTRQEDQRFCSSRKERGGESGGGEQERFIRFRLQQKTMAVLPSSAA